MPKGSDLTDPVKFFGLPVASDSFALLIDTSRSTGWNERLKVMRDECVGFINDLPEGTSFALARALNETLLHPGPSSHSRAG